MIALVIFSVRGWQMWEWRKWILWYLSSWLRKMSLKANWDCCHCCICFNHCWGICWCVRSEYDSNILLSFHLLNYFIFKVPKHCFCFCSIKFCCLFTTPFQFNMNDNDLQTLRMLDYSVLITVLVEEWQFMSVGHFCACQKLRKKAKLLHLLA